MIRGNIRGSLFEDGVDAGLSPPEIHKLVSSFEYDIDFFSDLRRGDDFSVIFEEKQYANVNARRGNFSPQKFMLPGRRTRFFIIKAKNRKAPVTTTAARL